MRTTRKTTAAAIGAIALLGLTACSSDAGDDADPTTSATTSTVASANPSATEVAEPTDEDIAAIESIEWTEGEDGTPALEFETPLTVSTTVDRVVTEGDGETVEDGSYVNLNYIGFDGADAAVLYDTYSLGSTQAYQVAEGMIADSLYDALIDQQVGSQIIIGETYANPDTEAEETQISSFTAVTIESITTPLERAEGTAVDPVDGLPVVTLDDDGKPSVEIPEGDAPTELVAQPLIEGEGDTVEATDTLVVNYSGWLWSDGSSFDSSWDRGENATFSLQGVIPGWTEGLTGQTVGSQMLLVVPPDMGYGDEDRDNIPAGSTLVFVVDILAAL